MKCPFYVLGIAAALIGVGCKSEPTATTPTPGKAGATGAEPKVQITDTVVGKGAVAENGDTLFMQYKGTLASDGTAFDDNLGSKPPFAVALGQGQVIKGWDIGLKGMKVGGSRKLHIPWQLAYGEQGNPPTIPGQADLNFDVKLLGLVKVGEELVVDHVDLKPGTGSRAVKDGDTVTVHYVGKYLNDATFADSRKKGKPYTFTIGKKQTISGMEVGILGMKVGGVRKVIVPPAAASAPGSAPTNQELVLEIELLAIK